MGIERAPLLERLVDFDRALTATERFSMRMDAHKEITRLNGVIGSQVAEQIRLSLAVLVLEQERDEARAARGGGQ